MTQLPPPTVPWQITGNHWLALPCIHPADASIHEKQTYAERMAGEMGMPLVRLIDGTGGGGSVKSLES